MKYAIWVFISCLLLSSVAEAQRSVIFGLHASPAVSWLSTSTRGMSSSGSKLNMHYGLNAEFSLTGGTNYYFGTGVDLISGGGEIERNSVVNVSDSLYPSMMVASYKMNYVQIPLTIKLRTDKIGYSIVTGEFGLGLGMRVRSLRTTESTFDDGLQEQVIIEEDVDATKYTRPFRLGLILGGGYERVITGDTYFRIDLTYNQAFNNLLKGNSYIFNQASGETSIVAVSADGEGTGPALQAYSRFIQLGFSVNF